MSTCIALFSCFSQQVLFAYKDIKFEVQWGSLMKTVGVFTADDWRISIGVAT